MCIERAKSISFIRRVTIALTIAYFIWEIIDHITTDNPFTYHFTLIFQGVILLIIN